MKGLSTRRIIALFFITYVGLLTWLHRQVESTDDIRQKVSRETGAIHLSDGDHHHHATANSTIKSNAGLSVSSKQEQTLAWRNLTVEELDSVRSLRGWDGQPIVVAEYKLIFFTQPKVASTVFKQLLRRMMHYNDWNLHQEPFLPHDPRYNKLRYMFHVPRSKWGRMLTSSDWTRVIFVRDPKERVLSAYLDKAARKNGTYVHKHCCPHDETMACAKKASTSFLDFLQVISEKCCCDPHWMPQTKRMDDNLWKFVNFVGHFGSLVEDTRRLLDRLSPTAWHKYGESGWGSAGNESIFSVNTHATHITQASQRTQMYYNSSQITELVETFYANDYESSIMNFKT